MKVIFSVLALVALSGCVGREIKTTVAFDPKEVAYINEQGTAKIEGQAFMRQLGGGVVTCAGSGAYLYPAGEYATQRMTQLYGSKQGGSIGFYDGAKNLGATEYLTMTRETICDASGNFTFENVADGEYYLTTTVVWKAGYATQGGHISKRIKIADGQSQKVILN